MQKNVSFADIVQFEETRTETQEEERHALYVALALEQLECMGQVLNTSSDNEAAAPARRRRRRRAQEPDYSETLSAAFDAVTAAAPD